MLTDSQMAHLVDMVLLQTQEIVILRASVLALLKIAHEAGIPDVQTRFETYSADLVKRANLEGSVALIQALEQISLRLKHVSGSTKAN